MFKRFIVSSIFYVGIVAAFAVIFSAKFHTITQMKGDEFFYTLYFMVSLTYLFSVYWYNAVFRKFRLFFLVFPIGNSLVSVIGGFIVLYLFSIRETPSQIILLYSLTYGSFTIVALFIIYSRIKNNKPPLILNRRSVFTRTRIR